MQQEYIANSCESKAFKNKVKRLKAYQNHKPQEKSYKKINNSYRCLRNITLMGILVPCNEIINSELVCKFKLLNNEKELRLIFNEDIEDFAEKLVWEKVKVEGRFFTGTELVIVKSICLESSADALDLDSELSNCELEKLKEVIRKYGKIETNEIAS